MCNISLTIFFILILPAFLLVAFIFWILRFCDHEILTTLTQYRPPMICLPYSDLLINFQQIIIFFRSVFPTPGQSSRPLAFNLYSIFRSTLFSRKSFLTHLLSSSNPVLYYRLSYPSYATVNFGVRFLLWPCTALYNSLNARCAPSDGFKK